MRVHQLARKHSVQSKYLAPELHKRGLCRHPSPSSWVPKANNWRVWLSVRAAKKVQRQVTKPYCGQCGSTCHTTVVNTQPASVLCCNCDMGGCP